MPKLNVEKVSSTEDRTLPVFSEMDRVMNRIRDRAHELFVGRGRRDGWDLADWLTAEREICWPAAELAETDDALEIKVALAGFEPKEIAVTATPHELIVKATHEKQRPKAETGDQATVRWSEFRRNDVYRHIKLPVPVDVDKISAEYNQGLLTIKAAKAVEERKSPKRIEISSAA